VRDKLGVKSRAVADKPAEDKKAAKASFEDKALAEDE
jgi:hypothetical protein